MVNQSRPQHSSVTALPNESSFDHITLTVGDLARMQQFYMDVIGLRVLERINGAARLGVGQTSMLTLREDRDTPPRRESEAGLFHLAIRVPTRAALARALPSIRDANALTGASDHGFSEAIYLRDPEDNGVEIYRDRQREDWPFDASGKLHAPTRPLDYSSLPAADDGTARLPADSDLGHVHLEVTNLERSLHFYRDLLGFDLKIHPGSEAAFLAAGEYHHHVALNTWNHRTDPATGRGVAEIRLAVPSNGELQKLRERMDEGGVTIRDRQDGFCLADPDRIRIGCTAQD